MKNQYFGDINDYRKYGLLRVLQQAAELSIGVCWMLTPDDTTRNGERRHYFGSASKFEGFDPLLFSKLRDWDQQASPRSVGLFAQAELLRNARYWDRPVPLPGSEREPWLKQMCHCFEGLELVFFDPDNGLEVKSAPWRRTTSARHLYWREVEAVFQRGHSVLVFQHFGRVRRHEFVGHLTRELKRRTGCAAQVLALRTAHVVFLLAPQRPHEARLTKAVEALKEQWRGQVWLQ
jgi:hypothetical protein